MTRNHLHIVFSDLEGSLTNIRRKNGNEWSSSCPKCGGKDRLMIMLKNHRGNPMAKCRQCDFIWFPGNEKPRKANHEEVSIVDTEVWEKRKNNLKVFQKVEPYIQFHQLLGDRGRLLWYDRGLTDGLIDYYKLGYKPDYKMDEDGNTCEALTIPCFDQDWKCTQVYYRLQKLNVKGKYRQHYGLAPALFIADPDEDLKKIVILVEGQIKAMITMEELFGDSDEAEVIRWMKNINVVAVPSCTPSAEIIEPLKDAKRIYVCFDPDTYFNKVGKTTPIERIISMLQLQGNKDVRELRLWDKIDDMILAGQLDGMDIIRLLKTAKRAK